MALASPAFGPVYKFAQMVGEFTSRRPPLETLLDNRTARFEQAHVVLPADAVAGNPVDATIQVWDQCERLYGDFDGGFDVETTDPEADAPERIRFPAGHGGVASLSNVTFETPGIQYLTLSRAGERYVSSPVRVSPEEPDERLYWGDVHLHSQFSDGCGSMADGLRFGRDVMDLDVVAYADHDTMGFFVPPRLQRRRMRQRYFDRMKRTVSAFHEEGEYVTLFAYEWTKQPTMGGHVNVYFDGVAAAELFDSMADDSDTYEKLFDRLREFNADHETQALAVPHHTAESSYPFDFASTDYDDEIAPLVEVYSQWGASERSGREGNGHPILMGSGEMDEPGYYVQDALAMGYRLGLTASSDYHGPHPGHSLIHADPHLPRPGELADQGLGWGLIWRAWNESSYPGGLQAVYADDLTREAVFESMRTRSVYGTSQPHRIRVDFRIDGVRFGQHDSTVALDAPDQSREVSAEVAGTAPIERLTVLKNNDPWHRYAGTDDPTADLETFTVETSRTDADPVTGMDWDGEQGADADVYYLRVRQADGGMAWAGPIWVEAP